MGKDFIQGPWSKSKSELHINLLELEAVFLTVKHFLPVLKKKIVLIRSDSTTVCQYVNRQGGTKSPPLCYRTWDLWNFALENNMYLKAAHILGSLNISTDQLSRVRVRPTEWQMHKVVANIASDLGDTPDRPICIQGEQTDSSLFFLDSTPRCIGNRCSVNLLGRNVYICVPCNMSHTQSSATYGAVSLSDYSHCTKMASQALVPRPSKIPDSMSRNYLCGQTCYNSPQQ